jgi:F-type H+-transporting ATPase subunit epsilon
MSESEAKAPEKQISGLLSLRVLTPERTLLEASVKWLQAPTEDGMLGIWPLHTPLIDVLAPGIIEYELERQVYRKRVRGGLIHVQPGRVTILTDRLEDAPVSAETEDKWQKGYAG